MRRDDFQNMVEQRRHAYGDLKAIEQRAREEDRRFTPTELKSWEDTLRTVEALNPKIEAGRAELAVATAGAGSGAELRSAGLAETTTASDRQIAEGIRSINKGESRALSTAVSISPGELSSTFFDRLRAASVVLSTGIRTLTIESDSVTYPALTGDAAPAWTAEAATIPPSDPAFNSVVATPRKLAALTQVSNEVLDDSDPALARVLNDHLIKVLGLRLDAGLIEGSGTPPEPTGLKNVTAKQSLVAGANGLAPTFDVFADAIALLEAVNVSRERMRIVVHPRNLATLRKAKASTAGTYLWGDPANAEPATVFGVPVVSTPQLAVTETQGTSGAVTNSAYVYDVENVVYVQRAGIEVEIDRSRLFNSDQSEFRAKLRGDLIVPNPTGLVRVTGLLA
jgi:HK97 family phage major capsid protein